MFVINKNYAIFMNVRVDVELYVFLTSEIDVGWWSVICDNVYKYALIVQSCH